MNNLLTSLQKTELSQLREFAHTPHIPIDLYLKDKLAGNGLHTHNYWEVFLSHSTPTGPIERATLVPPGIRHVLRQSVIGHYSIFFDIGGIEFRCSANFDRPVPAYAVPMVKVLHAHLNLMQKTLETLSAEEAQPFMELHSRILGEELVLTYEQTLEVKDKAFKHQPPKHIVGYLLRQAFQPNCNIADIASSLGISPTNISRIFKKEFGCSARRFLIISRLRFACEKLVQKEGNTSVSTIAMETGWSSPKYFKQVFRRMLGMTPRQFAERNHGKTFLIPDVLRYPNNTESFLQNSP